MYDEYLNYKQMISFYNWVYRKVPFDETTAKLDKMIKKGDIKGALVLSLSILEFAFQDTIDLNDLKAIMLKTIREKEQANDSN